MMDTVSMRPIAVWLLASIVSGCACGMNGSTQRIAVTSTPPGARVSIDGTPVGVTPVRVDVRRRDTNTVLKIEKEGFRPYEKTLQRSRSKWLALDIPASVFFGLAGYWVQGVRTTGSTAHAVLGAAAGFSPVLVAFGTGAAFTLPERVDARLGLRNNVATLNRDSRVSLRDLSVIARMRDGRCPSEDGRLRWGAGTKAAMAPFHGESRQRCAVGEASGGQVTERSRSNGAAEGWDWKQRVRAVGALVGLSFDDRSDGGINP